ncbi:MAG: TolB family protein, partial [Anaerolineae bacterium]
GTRAALLGAPESVDVFIVDLATDHLTRATQDELRERGLQWSPDGRYLAYVAGDPGTGAQALYILDTRTQQPAQVDMQPIRDALGLNPDASLAFDEQLTWLSDAQLVFYPQAGRRGRLAGIWYYDTASRMVQPILTDQLDATTWSAEARAWVYSRSGEPGALWLVRLDDPKPTLLVEGQAYAPVWSPNGQLVLFSWSDPETTGWDLRVVDLGGNTRTLVRDASMIQRETSELGPAGKRYWSPNGEFVLYTTVGRDYGRAEREGGYGGDAGPDLENWWIVQVNGGEPRQATDMQRIFYLQEPVLSPDGTSWAFIGFSYTDRLQHLYTMPRDGGHPEKVDVGVRWFEWLP